MANRSGRAARPANRPLRLRDGVVLGVASMVGAGLFTAFAPAAVKGGSLLVVAVLVAGLVAAGSAHSMIRLAARHPGSGGVYVYGRERLGLPWGYLAGWSFVVGQAAACAVMAMAIGTHLLPDQPKIIAVIVVLGALALNLQGVRGPERVGLWTVSLVVALTLAFVATMIVAPPVTADAPPPVPPGSGGVVGVLQGAGFLFFAFTGFARLAPLGELVHAPRRTIPRAIALSVAAVLVLYLLVAFALTRALGAGWVAAREAPIAEAAEISSWPWLGPALRIAAVLAIGSALVTLAAGVARIIQAMARDHHLPVALGRAPGSLGIPRRAEMVVAGTVVVIIVLVDLRGAIGYASFLLLTYYGIAHACAWSLDRSPVGRLVPALGLMGSIAIGVLLPWQSVVAGVITLALGAFTGWARWTTREDRAA